MRTTESSSPIFPAAQSFFTAASDGKSVGEAFPEVPARLHAGTGQPFDPNLQGLAVAGKLLDAFEGENLAGDSGLEPFHDWYRTPGPGKKNGWQQPIAAVSLFSGGERGIRTPGAPL